MGFAAYMASKGTEKQRTEIRDYRPSESPLEKKAESRKEVNRPNHVRNYPPRS